MKTNTHGAEAISARRGKATALTAISAAAFSYVSISKMTDHSNPQPVYALLWIFWLVLTLLWVFGQPGWFKFSPAQRAQITDERVRRNQSSSAKVGFGLALLSLAVVSQVVLNGLAIPVWLPASLTVGTVVLTAFVFVWLDHRDG